MVLKISHFKEQLPWLPVIIKEVTSLEDICSYRQPCESVVTVWQCRRICHKRLIFSVVYYNCVGVCACYFHYFVDDFQPYTRESQDYHCSQLDGPLYEHIATTYGIYRLYPFISSKFFHVCDGLSPDIMHDVLEGSLQYEVKELLKHLIRSEKDFSLKDLNEIIESFPFVGSDKAT